MKLQRETGARTLEASQRSSRVVFTTTIVGLVASVALNVLLARRVQSLTHARSSKIAEYQLKVGTVVPPIVAKRFGGQQEVISYQSTNQPTVLYVFTPPCSWCARNMDNLKALVDQENGRYRFIGLSLSNEGLAEYVAKNDLNLRIYSGLSDETKRAYKLSGTPETIAVSTEGKVLQGCVNCRRRRRQKTDGNCLRTTWRFKATCST